MAAGSASSAGFTTILAHLARKRGCIHGARQAGRTLTHMLTCYARDGLLRWTPAHTSQMFAHSSKAVSCPLSTPHAQVAPIREREEVVCTVESKKVRL